MSNTGAHVDGSAPANRTLSTQKLFSTVEVELEAMVERVQATCSIGAALPSTRKETPAECHRPTPSLICLEFGKPRAGWP
eukprot:3892531-Amphidinium_carterae.1